ncbi:MAG: membrane protein [Corynebacterium sp.]|nr:membrane protein [Corynebacterium sp.]
MNPRNTLKILQRTTLFTLGLFILAFGIAISIRANLGTGPVIAMPTVLSFATPLSVGTLSIIFNMVMVMISMVISGRSFPLFQLMQIPAAFLFGFFIDISMLLTPWVDPQNYLMQWIWVIISILIIAVGVHIEMKPKLTYIPADGLVALLAMKTPLQLGNVKMIFDWTLVAAATVLSLVLLGGLEGVREGTVAAAFGVGMILKLIANVEQQFRVDKRYD